MKATISDFLKLESAGGISLMIASVLALIAANSPLADVYDLFLDVPVEIRIGGLEIAKPLILWVNDGLMAVFFFLVGLELKREALEGELSEPANVMLPAVAAVGGIAVPVAVYMLFNYDEPANYQGWAIPGATDIAFALGILMLLGSRVPVALKVFLVSLAIFDDMAAIVIIAIFYTGNLSVTALSVAATCLVVLFVMSRRGVSSISPYLWVGLIMWVAVLKSGVHATLAGVALAAFIPMRVEGQPERSPLRELEHDLHFSVAFIILPLFAFANAGISFENVTFSSLLHPVPLGIAAGLFVGKQLGVFVFSRIAVALGIARLPPGTTWGSLYGVAALCGVGFTMSLFIATLAFEGSGTDMRQIFDERLGILVGSILSGVVGFIILHRTLPPSSANSGDQTD